MARRPAERYDADTLMAVALGVFHERGYDATSMADLAAAAGITKSAFYHHFPNKESLLERAMEGALDALFAVLAEPRANEGAAAERLAHVLRRLVHLEAEMLPSVAVLLRARGNTPVERAALDRRRAFDRAIAELIMQAQREGTFTASIEAHLAARLVVGMATWLVEWYHPGGALHGDALADAVARLALHGLHGPPV